MCVYNCEDVEYFLLWLAVKAWKLTTKKISGKGFIVLFSFFCKFTFQDENIMSFQLYGQHYCSLNILKLNDREIFCF